MKKGLVAYGLSMVLTWSGMAQAQVDLSALDKDMAGPRAQVLVLGSVHLAEMSEDFKPESLEPLLARLAAFKPEVITIESIPGESCDLMARHPTIYDPEGVSRYCNTPDEARAATGLDVPAAIAEVKKTLADWPAQPTPAQRRHLAALFLAAADSASALTQWLQVPEAERRAADGLDDALVAVLEKAVTRNDESHQIAARLAARLGLQRVFAIDDHTGDNYEAPDGDVKAFGMAIQQAWDAAAGQIRPMNQHIEELEKSGDMLAVYRFINRPEYRRVHADSDAGAALRETSPQHYGQLYVGGWETRNLRMVANIRATFIERPGARVLSIVGAAHKSWFDSLLGQMQGVDMVDVEKVLQAAAN